MKPTIDSIYLQEWSTYANNHANTRQLAKYTGVAATMNENVLHFCRIAILYHLLCSDLKFFGELYSILQYTHWLYGNSSRSLTI